MSREASGWMDLSEPGTFTGSGSTGLDVSGGDPTHFDDLLLVLRYLKKNGMKRNGEGDRPIILEWSVRMWDGLDRLEFSFKQP
jgi:hypothetical protein